MSDERCLPYRENIAAYALGALDPEDIPALEAHLAGCQECQADLAGYQAVTSGLLESVPPQMPSARVRRALIDRLPTHRSRTSSLLTDLFGRLPVGQLASALALLVLLALNVFSSMQIRELRTQQTSLAERLYQDQTAIAMLSYPSTQALTVHADVGEISGSMLVDKDKSTAVLVLWNLPQVTAGQTYQIWLIDPSGQRVSGGLFKPAGDQGYTTATIHSPSPFDQFVGVGVTVEPEGGSPGPTSPRVLGVDL